MSKPDTKKVDDECVLEPEEDTAGEPEEDTTIKNSDVVVRYKAAAKWANEVAEETLKKCVAGASILQLCQSADKSIDEKVKTNFKGAELKGVAFPTSISVGAAICHVSPVPGDDGADATLAVNDVFRLELGVHVDGYAGFVCQTAQVMAEGGAAGALNPESPEAAAIGAGYQAIDAALRQLRPTTEHGAGKSTYDVTAVIEKAAAAAGLKPLDGVLSHQLKRFIPDGYTTIPGRQEADRKVHEYDIEPHTVWALDVTLTTSKKGQPKATEDIKTTIYKQALEAEYKPKLEAAQQVLAEVEGHFFPFGVRNLTTKKARLGLSELLKHQVVQPVPVLFEKAGETVVRFVVTVLVTDKKIERISGLPPQAGTKKPTFEDEELVAASKLPLSLLPKKEKKK